MRLVHAAIWADHDDRAPGLATERGFVVVLRPAQYRDHLARRYPHGRGQIDAVCAEPTGGLVPGRDDGEVRGSRREANHGINF